MSNHTFIIKVKKLIEEDPLGYTIGSSRVGRKNMFSIPWSQTLKFIKETTYNPFTKKKEEWVRITVTEWIWNNLKIEKRLNRYLASSTAIIKNQTHFGINWDYIISKRRDFKHCCFCHGKLNDANRTADHLIPRSILQAYGYNKGLHNNTIPCCFDCNQEKSNLHPEVYRELVKRKIHEGADSKYRIIMFSLNQILKIS